MPAMRRVPPGRAGRLWLGHRLGVAERAADLLDRKVRVLRQEAARYALLSERSGEAWTVACRGAQLWALRAALLAGQAGLRGAAPARHAEVTLTWRLTMGAPVPVDVGCLVPEPPADVLVGPATAAAVDAARQALEAAVEHAAVLAARRAVEAELAATRHRLRAVTDRWIPRLTAAMAAAALDLEESERAEGVGLRWALRTTRPRDGQT